MLEQEPVPFDEPFIEPGVDKLQFFSASRLEMALLRKNFMIYWVDKQMVTPEECELFGMEPELAARLRKEEFKHKNLVKALDHAIETLTMDLVVEPKVRDGEKCFVLNKLGTELAGDLLEQYHWQPGLSR